MSRPPQVYLLTAVPLFSVPQLSASPVVNHVVILSLPHLLPVAHIGMVRLSKHPQTHKVGGRSIDRVAHNHQPTNRAPNERAGKAYMCPRQESIFWGKNGQTS